jgi:hypothetical protein
MALLPTLDLTLTRDQLAVLAVLEAREPPVSLQPHGTAELISAEAVAAEMRTRMSEAKDWLAASGIVEITEGEARISVALRELVHRVCNPDWWLESSVMDSRGLQDVFRLGGSGTNDCALVVSATDQYLRVISGSGSRDALRALIEELAVGLASGPADSGVVPFEGRESIPGWSERRSVAVVARPGPTTDLGAVTWLELEGCVWRSLRGASGPLYEAASGEWVRTALERLTAPIMGSGV